MIKLMNIFDDSLNENLQLADKLYFKTGKLSSKIRETIINDVTGGDAFTKIICDIYFALSGNKDEIKYEVLRVLKKSYNEIKNYNKNVFPIEGFDINGAEDIDRLVDSLSIRAEIISKFKNLPSIATRNMKSDIRQEREFYGLRDYLEKLKYLETNLNYLNNREGDAKFNILKKMFKSNTTLEELLQFIEDKGNLIGGENITKDMISKIIDKYGLNIIYNKSNKMVIEVDGPESMTELGCNSLWCFTYGNGRNYEAWSQYSHNYIVYLFIDFSLKSDDNDFMYVLTKPLDFFPSEDNEEVNDYKMFSMDNNDVYSPLNIVGEFMGLDKGRKLLNFNDEPQKKPKELRKKNKRKVDPNQLSFNFESSLSTIYSKLLKENNIFNEYKNWVNKTKKLTPISTIHSLTAIKPNDMLDKNIVQQKTELKNTIINFINNNINPNECFHNAGKVFQLFNKLGHESTFVLGLMIENGKVFGHAWNKIDGQYYDFSLAKTPEITNKYYPFFEYNNENQIKNLDVFNPNIDCKFSITINNENYDKFGLCSVYPEYLKLKKV